MNILFSQVREDSDVEISVIKKISNSNILTITSGGCTILDLLSQSELSINNIYAIDSNIEQNYLLKLKLLVIHALKNKKDIIDFFEGRYLKYDDFIDNLNDPFWNNNKEYIYNGINISGKFEILFKKYINKNILDYELTTQILSKNNLINIFGENAVVNSLNKEFYDHFYNIFTTYNELYNSPNDNYFYKSIVDGKYSYDCCPKYFNNIHNIIQNSDKINYINDNIINFISLNKNNIKFDVINLSNIFDWMDNDNRQNILHNIKKILNNNSYIISRRLNGDYDLKKLMEEHFLFESIEYDKSHFYSEVVICKYISEYNS